jgi:hypothetical protein
VSRYDNNETYDGSARYDDFSVPLTRRQMKAKLGLDRLSPEQKVTAVKTVKTKMTENAAIFTNPPITMTALGTLITTAEDGIAAYEAGAAATKLLLTQRDAGVAAMCAGAMQELSYVDSKAAGNAVMIEQAGMAVRSTNAHIGPMPKVQGLKLSISDRPGDTDWMCGPVNGVSVYLLQTNRVNPDTEAEWKYADSSTKSSGTLKGNAPGKIWVRVAAKGADDQPGPWSDPAEDLVR